MRKSFADILKSEKFDINTEYIRLKNPEFQKNVAKSIKKSIETYINMLKK